MQLANIPAKFSVVWGASAAPSTIRTVPISPSGQPGAASFETGFTTLNFVAVAAGGVPPFGQDVNGVLEVITEWAQWAQAGGAQPFDAAFAASIGGYPKSCILPAASQAGVWYSLADNNLNNPDTGGANWVLIGPAMQLGGMLSGTVANAVIRNGVITAAMIVANVISGAQIIQAPAPGFFGALAAGNGGWLSVAQALSILGTTSLTHSTNADTEQWTFNNSGFIIAFGRTTRTINHEGAQDITLPTPFPTQCLGTMGNALNTENSALQDLWVQTTENNTASTLEFFCQGTSSTPGHIDGIEWIAFGN